MTSKSLRLSEISSLIDQAYLILEERKRLVLLEIAPSISDNQDLRNVLVRTTKKLASFEDDLVQLINNYNSSSSNGSSRVNGSGSGASSPNGSTLVSSIKKSSSPSSSASGPQPSSPPPSAAVNRYVGEFNGKVFQYDKLLANVEMTLEKESVTVGVPTDGTIRVEDYKFAKRELPELAPAAKSVRFKDNLIEASPTQTQKSAPFKPYRDDESEDNNQRDKGLPEIPASVGSVHRTTNTMDTHKLQEELEHEQARTTLFAQGPKRQQQRYRDNPGDGESGDGDDAGSLSNQNMFAQQQQVLTQQDSRVDDLAASVRRQREMGLSINDELDSQMVILDDVEAQMDRADRRLTRAKRNLGRVNKKLREHGHCFTITVLVVILFFLVIVL